MKIADAESQHVSLSVSDGEGTRRESDDVSVRYRVAGEGPPVVLLHGVGLDAADVSWRYALPALAETHRVYAPDLPGHGDSGKPDRRYTTTYFRAALETFLDELGLNGAGLVGVSMGGGIALGHALDHPVEKLVLVDSYGLGTDAGWRPPAWALLRTPFAHRTWWRSIASSRVAVRRHLDTLTGDAAPRDLVEDVYRAVQVTDVGRTVASWQRSEFLATGLRTDHSDRLAELDADVLFVHGAADPLIPMGWSKRAAAVTGGEFAPFADAGHWPPRERPDRFNEQVRTFLT